MVEHSSSVKINCIRAVKYNCCNKIVANYTQPITCKELDAPEGIIISTELNVGGGGSRPQISAHDLDHVNKPDCNHKLEADNTSTITTVNFSKAVQGKKHLINHWINFDNNTIHDGLYVQTVYDHEPHYTVFLRQYRLDTPTYFNVLVSE